MDFKVGGRRFFKMTGPEGQEYFSIQDLQYEKAKYLLVALKAASNIRIAPTLFSFFLLSLVKSPASKHRTLTTINNLLFQMKTLKILFVFCGLTSTSFSQIINHYWDLKNPSDWHLSSVPYKQMDIFPESYLQNDLTVGFNRARICWYYIDPIFQSFQLATPSEIGLNQMQNHFVREIPFNEVYTSGQANISMTNLNLDYYPVEKGPYNFDVTPTLYSNGISMDGALNSPELRWGGIMRTIPMNIFTINNLNYLGFWLMDPFVYDSISTGGNLYINIGNVSEDILKDSKRSSEGGLPTTSTVTNVDTTIWGRVSDIALPLDTFASDNSKQFQDIGLDGLINSDELLFFGNYLNSIATAYGAGSSAYSLAANDPCSDDYYYFLDAVYDNLPAGVLDRYKKFNSTEGNTGVFNQGSPNYSGASNIPDDEDISGNDILDTAENYYQYKIVLNRDSFIVGQNFITDKINLNPSNGDGTPVTWYKFLIPLNTNQKKVIGNINNLDSSGFVRLFLKDFSKEVNLRFFELAFVTSDLTTVNDIQNKSGISVYPNPSTGIIEIDNSNYEINSIKVYDMLGKILYSTIGLKNTTTTTIDLSGLNSGMYFIEILSQNIVFKQRIIIEK